MSTREKLFAAALLCAGAAIVVGVALLHQPTAWIVGGLLGAAWAWAVLAEVGK